MANTGGIFAPPATPLLAYGFIYARSYFYNADARRHDGDVDVAATMMYDDG